MQIHTLEKLVSSFLFTCYHNFTLYRGNNMQLPSLKSAMLVASLGVILGGCATTPEPVKATTKYEAPVVQTMPVYHLQSESLATDACCYRPSEIVKYQNKPVAECSKPVEVIRYKNACNDCPYPVVVRADSVCSSNK
jgi:hypothetical protein